MLTAIYGIIIFFMLIFPHELGHFISAKLCGIRVNEFALGMGPTLWKKKKGETKYSLRLFPVGGFCAMEGEDESSDDERAFDNKPVWQRLIVLVAGSFMNLLIAVIIMICLTFYTGVATTTVDNVIEGSPAYEAGLQHGDEILKVNGKDFNKWEDLRTFLAESEDDIVEIEFLRNGEKMTAESGIMKSEDGRKVIGITSLSSHGFFKCIGGGLYNSFYMIKTLGDAFRRIFTGQVGMNELGGPVAIVKVAGDAGKAGIASFLYLASFISLNLALFNMFPLPALDGGRVVFLIIRKITGKAITKEIEGKVHFVGLLLLFALMIYVTWNDIMRLFH